MAEKKMIDYIRVEQDRLMSVLKNRHKILATIEKYFLKNQPKNWKILATGSSANAILSAKFYVEKIADVSVHIEIPSIMVHYHQDVSTNDFCLAVSQTGRSASIIQALRRVSVERFGLTQDSNSPIAKEVHHIIPLAMEEETVDVVTLGFSITTLTFWLIGLEAARIWKKLSPGQYEKEIYKLEQIISQINPMINTMITWEEQRIIDENSLTHVNIIGYGPGFGVSKEAETKIVETLMVAANGYELEEFMHGPNYAIAPEKSYIAIKTDSSIQGDRIQKLTEYVERFSTQSVLFDLTKLVPIEVDELLTPILAVIPFQYLVYKWTENMKIDFMHTVHDDFDLEFNSKI